MTTTLKTVQRAAAAAAEAAAGAAAAAASASWSTAAMKRRTAPQWWVPIPYDGLSDIDILQFLAASRGAGRALSSNCSAPSGWSSHLLNLLPLPLGGGKGASQLPIKGSLSFSAKCMERDADEVCQCLAGMF